MRQKIAAGNWKMNGSRAAMAEIDAIAATAAKADCLTLICPPAPLISAALQRGVAIGAQDCHVAASGAHTGEVSAEILADTGASHVILGHSERRAAQGEQSRLVAKKAEAAWRAGLVAIICVGETEAEYRAGQTLEVIKRQLSESTPTGATPDTTVIAYEPVWAIGTGLTPSTSEISDVHRFMRTELDRDHPQGEEISLLYGGSVKPTNASEIFAIADVDGALVGGASLTSADFSPIITALSAS